MIPRSRLIAILLYLFCLSELLAFGPTLPWNSSIEAGEKALRAGKDKNGYEWLSEALSSMGKTDMAAKSYQQSLELYEPIYGPDEPAFANFLTSYVEFEKRRGRTEKASHLRARARVLRTTILPGTSRSKASMRVRVWIREAVSSGDKGQIQHSEDLWLAARMLARRAGLIRLMAECSRNLAFSSARSRHWDEAAIRFARAEDDLRRAHGEDSAFRKAYDAYLNSDGANSPGVVFTDVTWREAITKSRGAKAIDRIMTPIILAESKLPPVKKVIGLWLSLAQIMSFNDPKKCEQAFLSIKQAPHSFKEKRDLASIVLVG